MGRLVALMLFMVAMAGYGQSGPETTSTRSDEFETLAEKVEFLERYVTFDRTYHSLDYVIDYFDGGRGMLPAPSEWDIRIVAVVPKDELGQWSSELHTSEPFDIGWVESVGVTINHFELERWYCKGDIEVAVDEDNSTVIYRNVAI